MENREIKDNRIEEGKSQSSVLEDHARDLLNDSTVITPLTAGEKAENALPQLSLTRLANANEDTLNNIYKNASAGSIPEGDTTGKAIFLPGTKAGDFISKIGDDLWSGKVFADNGDLVNKIAGHNFIHANVQKGQSWFDGKESIIIDYKGRSPVAGFIRDEIREVNPGLYLGKMYARLPFNNRADVLFFALESNKKS